MQAKIKIPRKSLRITWLAIAQLILLLGVSRGQEQAALVADSHVKLAKQDGSVRVEIAGKHFTTFDFKSFNKPILYPILGPGQIPMTRNWPIVKGVPGEEHDHPHHKSMWISHEFNGMNFWTEKGGRVNVTRLELDPQNDAFVTNSDWKKRRSEAIVLTDETTYRFGASPKSRWIDCHIKLIASHGELTIDDSKEGFFAIRTHPDLRLTARPKKGVAKVFGKAANSEGISGKAIWGKKAKWVCYQGTIEQSPMSIAMFDHPSNLRHPTTWMARDYGLIAANPFGLHYFSGAEPGAGAVTLTNGNSLSLRYRVEFLEGLHSNEEIERRYQDFCQPLKNLKTKK